MQYTNLPFIKHPFILTTQNLCGVQLQFIQVKLSKYAILAHANHTRHQTNLQ